jgi:hypothetical protein
MPVLSGLAAHDVATCRCASCTREKLLLQYSHCVRFARVAPPPRRRVRRGAGAGAEEEEEEGAADVEVEVGVEVGAVGWLLSSSWVRDASLVAV